MTVCLARLRIGQEARITAIRSARPSYVSQLSRFVVLPGCRLRVRQLRPVIVIQVGETELALDRRAGREIFVRPAEEA